MKFFGFFLRDGRIKDVHFLGFYQDEFINGVKHLAFNRAVTRAQNLFDTFEHDFFYVTKIDELVSINQKLQQAINDSNFPVK